MSAFSHVSETPSQQIAEGLTARSTHGARLTLTLIELEPGTALAEHAHLSEQLGLLLAGTLDFQVAGEHRSLVVGSTWCIPANTPHSGHAGPEGAVLIEGFAPPRSEWDALPLNPPSTGRWP